MEREGWRLNMGWVGYDGDWWWDGSDEEDNRERVDAMVLMSRRREWSDEDAREVRKASMVGFRASWRQKSECSVCSFDATIDVAAEYVK